MPFSPSCALSSSPFSEQIARTSDAGFDLFLSKPITPVDLREAVHRLDATRILSDWLG